MAPRCLGVLAFACLSGAADAYITLDLTGDLFSPPPVGWQTDGDTVNLPCALEGSLGLPPCVGSPLDLDRIKDGAGHLLQHACWNVVSPQSYASVCVVVSPNR
jgi:hypothetical protein